MKLDSRVANRIVRDAAGDLKEAGVPEPEASAELLLSELLGVSRAEILANRPSLSEKQRLLYECWISRRRRREPVQRILGHTYFRYLKLRLNKESLVPRPDTESVVEAALEFVDRCPEGCKVLDLGSGSGAIAISVAQERPFCEVHATDISKPALEVARRNTEKAGVKVNFHHRDLFDGLEELHGRISLLVSNPPYVRSADLPNLEPEVRDWDPHPALDGGPDGLLFYRRIFAGSGPLLEDGAHLVLEVGDDQDGQVLKLGREAGFVPLGTRKDLTGKTRAVALEWRKG